MRNKKISAIMRKMLDGGLVVIDVETTGTSKNDRVIELAIMNSVGGVNFQRRFGTDAPMNPFAQKIHGITAEDIQGLPPIGIDWKEIGLMLSQRRVFAHNVSFDKRLLKQSLEGHPAPSCSWHCSMLATMRYLGLSEKIKLKDACEALRVPYDAKGHHGAVADCRMALGLLRAIADEA